MAVTPTQSSRWTTSEPIGPQADRFLRVLVALGPELIRRVLEAAPRKRLAREASSQEAKEALEDITQVIHRLPPSSAEAKAVKIGLRRSGTEWKQDITACA